MGGRGQHEAGLSAGPIAGLSALVRMPYYPIWSLTYVGLAVLVF